MKLKNLLMVGVLFLSGIALSPAAPARADIGTCPGDYFGFILTARSAATRPSSFSDYFKLGYCQLNDILKLEDELSTLRTEFQKAADSCSDTSDYKSQYNEILMEEYFVRNIQTSKSDVINEVDEAKLKALKEAKLANLKSEMEELFVNQEQRVDEGTFNSDFTNWSSKYDDRIANYAHCEEGPWAELQTTWQKFVDDIDKISVDVKDTASGDTQHLFVTNTSSSDTTTTDMSGEGESQIDAYQYMLSQLEQKKASVKKPSSVKDVANSGQSMTYSEVLQTLKSGSQTFALQTNGADRMANYALLYGSGGAVGATNMQSILIYMNKVVAETNTKDFPNITKSAGQVYDKQCQ